MLKRLSGNFTTLILTLLLEFSAQCVMAKEDIFVTMENIHCHIVKKGHGTLQCKMIKPSMAFKNQQGEMKELPLTVDTFIGLWKKDTKPKGSFAETPPNAILTFTEGDHTCQAELVVADAHLKKGDIYFTARPLSKEKSFKIDGERVSEKNFLEHINKKDKSNITLLIDDVWCLLDGRC